MCNVFPITLKIDSKAFIAPHYKWDFSLDLCLRLNKCKNTVCLYFDIHIARCTPGLQPRYKAVYRWKRSTALILSICVNFVQSCRNTLWPITINAHIVRRKVSTTIGWVDMKLIHPFMFFSRWLAVSLISSFFLCSAIIGSEFHFI